MKSSTFILSVAFVFSGCTTSSIVLPQVPGERSTLNESLKGSSVTIAFTDGAEVDGTNFFLDADSTRWINSSFRSAVRVLTDSIRSVRVRSSTLGTAEGLGIGLAGGLILSAILWPHPDHSGSPSPNPQAILALAMTPLGGLTGLYYGAELGHTFVYSMQRLPDSIRILSDSETQSQYLRHVIVQLASPKKDVGVFGVLISDTPVVILRISRDRIWKIPSSFVRVIEPIRQGNLAMSGFNKGWLITRNDSSTVVCDTLVGYLNDTLEVRCAGSTVNFPAGRIKTLQRFNNQTVDFSTNIAAASRERRDTLILYAIQKERERTKK